MGSRARNVELSKARQTDCRGSKSGAIPEAPPVPPLRKRLKPSLCGPGPAIDERCLRDVRCAIEAAARPPTADICCRGIAQCRGIAHRGRSLATERGTPPKGGPELSARARDASRRRGSPRSARSPRGFGGWRSARVPRAARTARLPCRTSTLPTQAPETGSQGRAGRPCTAGQGSCSDQAVPRSGIASNEWLGHSHRTDRDVIAVRIQQGELQGSRAWVDVWFLFKAKHELSCS